MNTPRFSRYKTVEASMNKRLSNRWSMQAGGSHTWAHDFPGDYPNNPNATDVRRGHDALGLQGVGHVRSAVRHPRLAAAASPGGRELRAHRSRSARRARPRSGAIFSGTINAEPLELPPARQHHGARRARRSGVQPRAASMRVARLLRPVQHHEQPTRPKPGHRRPARASSARPPSWRRGRPASAPGCPGKQQVAGASVDRASVRAGQGCAWALRRPVSFAPDAVAPGPLHPAPTRRLPVRPTLFRVQLHLRPDPQ